MCRSCNLLVGVDETTCYHCGTPYPGLWGFGPVLRRLGSDLGFTSIVMVTCGVLYVVALALDPGGIGTGGLLRMLSPSGPASYLLGASGSVPVFGMGRWWTVLSAGWLHGSLLHIGFNLMWVRQLAPVTADIYGPGRAVLIYTAVKYRRLLLEQPGRTFSRGTAPHWRSPPHFGCFGRHFRAAGSSGLRWPAGGCLERQPPGPDLCRHSVRVGLHNPWNRQLGPRGGIRGRIRNCRVSESAPSRAPQSPGGRRCLPGPDGGSHRSLLCHGCEPCLERVGAADYWRVGRCCLS